MKNRVAIFASGNGSNALNLLNHFKNHQEIEIGLLFTNNPISKIIEMGVTFDVPVEIGTNTDANDAVYLIDLCSEYKIDYIVLAGYLRLVPKAFIVHFAQKIFNIHPSLLPKFGGKGMYGDHVHQAVLQANEKETGITIHHVTPVFDEGMVLAQFKFEINKDDLNSLREKISFLEKIYLPYVIENTIIYDRIF